MSCDSRQWMNKKTWGNVDSSSNVDVTVFRPNIFRKCKAGLIPVKNINKTLTPISFTPRIKTLMNKIIFVECKAFKIGLQTQSFLAFTIYFALRTIQNAENKAKKEF